MSQHIVCRAGISVAGLLLMGSGVASATELPALASSSTPMSITTAAYAGCNQSIDFYDWCCQRRVKPPKPLTVDRPKPLYLCVGSRDLYGAAGSAY